MLRDLIRPYIDQIVKRELTNRELARTLNVREESICRVLKQLKVVREAPVDTADQDAARRELQKTRLEFRLRVAAALDVKAAAAAAHCSTRTIYRLRKKHEGL